MIITLVVMAAITGGFSVNADQELDITYPILNTINEEDNNPYRFEVEELVEDIAIPKDEKREVSEEDSDGTSWIYTKVQDGEAGLRTIRYELLYNRKGDLLSKIKIPEASHEEKAKPTIYEGGQYAHAGAFYDASTVSRYGANSKAPNSAGVELKLDSVKQQDGSWENGIMYEGYYIVATSSAIPLFSILEISDHGLSGSGIESGVPFKAIVLDHVANQGPNIDLFIGSEDRMPVSMNDTKRAHVKIVDIDNDDLMPIVIPEPEPVITTQAAPAVSEQSTGSGDTYSVSRITRYGVNCYGCNISADGRGSTASGVGVGLDSVRQSDGTWQQGITYDGYYIVATSSDIPLFSIIEISDHTVSGMGIEPGVPFQAIVLDRGGAIQGSKIDLFVGTENNMPVTQGSRQDAQARVIR